MQEDPFNAYIISRFNNMLDHLDSQEKYLTPKIENDHDYLKKQAKTYLQHQDGDILLRDKALTIYTRLAEAGDIDSQFDLAILLLESEQPVSEEIEQGRHWLTASANADHEREAIKRLKLHGLTAAQKKSYVENWYFTEMKYLDQKDNPQKYLKIINDQRDALLSSTP